MSHLLPTKSTRTALKTTPTPYFNSWCFKSVGCSALQCKNCHGNLYKHGKTNQNKQRYRCSKCGCTQLAYYSYNAYHPNLNNFIVALTKEGVGIRSTARLLCISPTTLISRIKAIANQLKVPALSFGKSFEVDELRTFIGRKKKLIWVVSALQKDTNKIVRFSIGPRTNKTLRELLTSLELAKSKNIYTDNLKQYKYLIEKKKHSRQPRGTNHIERAHLNLRTHLKRLNRKTICFSKSALMLKSVLKIYLWS